MEYQTIVHPFGPLYNENSQVLILGSLPSVKSREENFFYGHPQNRFWPMMAELLQEPMPQTNEEKRQMMLRHGIAMWDTIYSCEIKGSSDSSIRNVTPTDLKPILEASRIHAVFCNGKTSWNYYHRYQEKIIGIPAVALPSTSPANAAWNRDRLKNEWRAVTEALE